MRRKTPVERAVQTQEKVYYSRDGERVRPGATSGRINVPQWREEYVEMAHKLALLGCTYAQISNVLGISLSSFNDWMRRIARFRDAVLRGKTLADAEVAHSVYRTATGYEYEEEQASVSLKTGEVFKVTVKKFMPPNGLVGLKWLALRDKERWTLVEKSERTLNLNVKSVDLAEFTDQELKVMERLGLKALNTVPQNPDYAGRN